MKNLNEQPNIGSIYLLGTYVIKKIKKYLCRVLRVK